MDELTAIRSFRPTQAHDGRAAENARAVLRRAVDRSRRWTRPRILVAVAVLAAAGATAAGATGLGDRVIDFVAGEPAPPPVQRQLGLMSRHKSVVPWFEQQPGSEAIASKARGVLAIETSVGPVYLWMAPTRGGGFCHMIDIEANSRPDGSPAGGGGCSPHPQPPDEPFVLGPNHRKTLTRRGYLRLLEGRVGPHVASVEVRFVGGERVTLRPAEGFFLRELAEGEDPDLIIARDESGAELARRSMRSLLPPPGKIPQPIGPYRTLIEIETSWGYPMSFAVAPGAAGTVCTQIRYRRARSGGCNRQPDADEIWVGHSFWNETEDRKPVLVLQGSVGRSIARLELEYRDGGRTTIPIVEGHVLFELSRDRPPKELVGLGADGSIVARRPLR
jgi:hypothetical protein